MKKIIALTLAFLISSPLSAFALVPAASTGVEPGGGTPFVSDFCDTTDASGNCAGVSTSPTVNNPAPASDAAQSVTCPSNAGSGGSVAGAVGSSGLGSVSGVANCLLGAVKGGGSITSGASCLNGALGGSNSAILGQFLGIMQHPTAGNIAHLVLTAFPGIAQAGTQALNGILGSLGLGNLGGGVGSALSGLLGGGGLGSALGGLGGGLGGLAGGLGGLAGGLGGLAGGILGGIGGAEVPTYSQKEHKTAQEISTHTHQTNVDDATNLHIRCVDDPTTDQLHKQALNQINAQAIADSAKFTVENHGVAAVTAEEYTNKKFVSTLQDNSQICSTVKPVVVQQITAIIQEETSGDNSGGGGGGTGTQPASCNPPTTQSGWDQFKSQLDGANRSSVVLMDAISELGRKQKASDAEVAAQITDGRYAKGTCPDDPKNPNGGRHEALPSECGSDFKANTPAADIANVVHTAENSGSQQLLNSKHVGENVSPQVTGIVTQLLSTLMGFLGLSQSSGGHPSYTSQISGTTDASATDAAKTYLVSAIGGSIGTEDQYQQILSGMIDDLNQTRTAYDAVRQCYVSLMTKTVSGLSSSDITARIDQASTTEALVFDPQIADRTQQYNDSIAIIGELQRLKDQASQATTPDELNAVSTAVDSLQAAGLVHSNTDITQLSDDATANQTALQAATAAAQTQLTECQAF